MIFVTVTEPRGRQIYVNGVHSRPLGPTPTCVVLEAGSHIFQTLTGQNLAGSGSSGLVDFEGEVIDVPDFGSATIDLAPVVPPKPKDA